MVSACHVGGTHGPGSESSAADVLRRVWCVA